MQWVRAADYCIRRGAGSGEEYIVPLCGRLPDMVIDPHKVPPEWRGVQPLERPVRFFRGAEKVKRYLVNRGFMGYDAEPVKHDLLLALLNAKTANDALSFARRFGLLGLYWWYAEDEERLPLAEVERYVAIKANSPFRFLARPPLNNGALMLRYVERVGTFLREARRFQGWASELLAGRASPNFWVRASLSFHDGKPAWIPETTTLLGYCYAVLPILLAQGWPLRRCKNERCPQPFFLGRANREYCSERCKWAHGKRLRRAARVTVDGHEG